MCARSHVCSPVLLFKVALNTGQMYILFGGCCLKGWEVNLVLLAGEEFIWCFFSPLMIQFNSYTFIFG